MSKVIFDQATLAKLHHLTDRVEVCDESGCTHGFFLPLSAPLTEVPFSDEELDQFEQAPGNRPLAEILLAVWDRQTGRRSP